MFIGIYTLFMMLFGANDLDVFYIDKIEQGINKHVDDKGRKKKLDATLKDYTKTLKEFNKKRKSQIKDLKKKNLIISTSDQWYKDFFESRMNERKALQSRFIDQRIILQDNITEAEWDGIMKIATDEATKLSEKEQKKEMKKKNQNLFDHLEKTIHKSIIDESKVSSLLEVLSTYKKSYMEIDEAYDDINVNESEFLSDKNATKEQMQNISDRLNEQRLNMYQVYIGFIAAARQNTDAKEWEIIIKEFNKVLE